MANKNKDEDPEEDKKDQFDDDEDFGLPDLEYEELEDDDESDSGDQSSDDEVFGTTSDTTETPSESDWNKDLEQEPAEEPKADDSEDKDELFYEEESYDEFEQATSESDEPVFDSGAGDTTPPPAYTPQYDTGDSSKGKFARVVVIGTLLFAVIAIVFWLVSDSGSPEPKEPIAEVTPPVEETIPADTTPVVEEPIPEPEPDPRDNANQRTPGEITVLEQQTGKSYIIIGSFFDGDLAGDYAQKLSKDGKSPLIIPPFKNYRFHRVAIAEFESFKDAQASIGAYKQEYGDSVWPLRY